MVKNDSDDNKNKKVAKRKLQKLAKKRRKIQWKKDRELSDAELKCACDEIKKDQIDNGRYEKIQKRIHIEKDIENDSHRRIYTVPYGLITWKYRKISSIEEARAFKNDYLIYGFLDDSADGLDEEWDDEDESEDGYEGGCECEENNSDIGDDIFDKIDPYELMCRGSKTIGGDIAWRLFSLVIDEARIVEEIILRQNKVIVRKLPNVDWKEAESAILKILVSYW